MLFVHDYIALFCSIIKMLNAGNIMIEWLHETVFSIISHSLKKCSVCEHTHILLRIRLYSSQHKEELAFMFSPEETWTFWGPSCVFPLAAPPLHPWQYFCHNVKLPGLDGAPRRASSQRFSMTS